MGGLIFLLFIVFFFYVIDKSVNICGCREAKKKVFDYVDDVSWGQIVYSDAGLRLSPSSPKTFAAFHSFLLPFVQFTRGHYVIEHTVK